MQLVSENLPGSEGFEQTEDIDEEEIAREEELNKRIRAKILSMVTWTKEEQSWRNEKTCPQKLKGGMVRRIKCAATGCFVSNWNFGEEGDICEDLSRLDLEKREGRLNGWCEDEEELLRTLLHESPSGFSWHRLIHYITSLRLSKLQISEMDNTLSQLIQIKALIMTSNLINAFNGSLLPRDLRFLELYNNMIEDIDELGSEAPPNLLYLGVGRNHLSSNESLEGLSKFRNLYYLDVSDNDCLLLPAILKTLPCLNTLTFFGTPYSMAVSYRRIVNKELPNLLYLDEVDLQTCLSDTALLNEKSHKKSKNKDKKDGAKSKTRDGKKGKKHIETEEEYDLTGELQVYLFRVFGVPQPQNEKNVKHVYYFELECPLLDKGLKEYEMQQAKQEDEEAERRRLQELEDGQVDLPGKYDSKSSKGKSGDKGSKHKSGDSKISGGRMGESFQSRKRRNKSGASARSSKSKAGKKIEDKETIKLFPISKKCSERHKLGGEQQWQSPLQRCFLLGATGGRWKSVGGNEKGTRNLEQNYQDATRKNETEMCPGEREGDSGALSGKGNKGSKMQKRASGKSASKRLDGDGRKSEKLSKKDLAAAKLQFKMMQENFNKLLDKDVEIEGCTKFKSNEVGWARILVFKPIIISTTDLLSLRDTFRTVLKLRLIHAKVSLNTGKTKDESKKGRQEASKTLDEGILMREKLAVIPVPLEAIKWNEMYLGYTWGFDKPCLAEKYPDVKDMKFAKVLGKEEIKSGNKKAEGTLPQEPQILTVHLGVGVKRDSYE